jgi:hypothetical protein
LKESNEFYKGLLPQLDQLVDECTHIVDEYQVMVKQYREAFGHSSSQKMVQRKRKKNAVKQLKAKQSK